MLNKILKTAKSILCLDGKLPEKTFFSRNKLPIIAADGAAIKLRNIDVKPSVIIGDFDSINVDEFSDSQIIFAPSQDQTDFQKSIQYLKNQDLLPTIITGVNGGFLDHILNNINIILENNLLLYDDEMIGYTLNSPSILELSLIKNTKISILGFNNAKVSTSGLKWELENSILNFPGYNSCLNRTAHEKIKINATEGKVLILVYLIDAKDNGLI